MKTTITASRGRCTFAPLGAVRSAMSWVTSTPSACPATISTTWDTATSVGKAKSVVSGAASIMPKRFQPRPRGSLNRKRVRWPSR